MCLFGFSSAFNIIQRSSLSFFSNLTRRSLRPLATSSRALKSVDGLFNHFLKDINPLRYSRKKKHEENHEVSINDLSVSVLN